MENKDLIIIALVIIVIYLYYKYYHQLNSSLENLAQHSASLDELTEARTQLIHYQTLYQKRIAKDLDAERLQVEIQGWVGKYKDLEKLNSQQVKQIEGLTLLANKRKEDLVQEKQALINLAQQKIKGKKEFQALVKQLEYSWQQDKANWEQEKNTLITQQAQQIQELETKSQELKSVQAKELEQKSKDYQQLEADLTETKKENQAKLRKINLLFDDQAESYKIIDFEGLYSLLTGIQQNLSKSHQESSTQTEPDETEQALDELLTNIRKLNSEL